MDDQNKFPFELPTGDESPAKNPPASPSLGGPMAPPSIPSRPTPPPIKPVTPPVSQKPEVNIITGGSASPSSSKPDFFSPETFQASPVPSGVKTGSNLIRNIAVAVVAVVFVGGVGALSYFVIFPLLFPPQGGAPVAQIPPTLSHKTFLVQTPAASVQLNLNDHNYLTIATALQGESFNQLLDGQSKEVEISEKGQQVSFPTFLSAVAPVASALGDSGYFENDFTAILYYDASGVWPVYVAKLKDGTNPDDVVNAVKSIEGVLDVPNFYLAPPGSFSGFKDGKVGDYSTRYSVGTQAGAALNYGVMGNYFAISTSYNGLRAAVPLLGL